MLKKMYSILLGSLMLTSISTIMPMEEASNPVRSRALALAMCRHPRLGANSPARNLPSHIIEEILLIIKEILRPARNITIRNSFRCPYISNSQEEISQNRLSEVFFVRIRDYNNLENLIWQRHLAGVDNCLVDEQGATGAMLRTEGQIPIPHGVPFIRIAFIRNLDPMALSFHRQNPNLLPMKPVYVKVDTRNLQEIEISGEVGQNTSSASITCSYTDNTKKRTRLFG